MKRGADKQLTKDDGDDDDDIQEIQDPQGFQAADESALAKRQIRALPKRALAASKLPALNGLPPAPASGADNVDTAPPPKFGGFVGFGAGAPASSPFSFGAQPPPPSTSAPSSSPNPPPVSPFLGPPKQSPLDADPNIPKPGMSPPAEEIDAVALEYFKSLRGLNVSFLSAISSAVEKDPFADVASLVDSYKNLRTTIQSEFDGSSKPPTTRAPVAVNSVFSFAAKPPAEKTASLFSMSKPFTASTETSSKPPSSGDGTKTGGFTFPPFVPPSIFAPASKPSESSTLSSTAPPEPSGSPFKFPASGIPASTSSLPPISNLPSIPSTENKLTFASSGHEIEASSANSSFQPVRTAPSFGSTTVPNFFATAKPMSAFADAASKPASAFGTSIFGSSSTTESSSPSPFNPPPSDGKEGSQVTSTLFGNVTTMSSATSTSGFGSSSDKPASFFGSASPPKASAFTFGKSGGSIGNPVGFGFGSPAPSTSDGPSSSGFSFAAPSTKSSESLFSPPMTDKSIESTPQPEAEGAEEGREEDATKLLPSHTHDEEGEGEEDEVTTHVVRCKIYRLSNSENKNEWKDLGIGMLRLKRHKETHARRILMRNSSTGRILTNFRIYEGLKPSLAKTSIAFVGYENSMPTSFRIRLKTEEQAQELKQAMEREIAAVRVAK